MHEVIKGKNALTWATNKECKDSIQDFEARYPMITAIQKGQRGLDINAQNAQEKTEAGYTTLMAARQSCNQVLMEKLMNCGADIGAQDIYNRQFLCDTPGITFMKNNIPKKPTVPLNQTEESKEAESDESDDYCGKKRKTYSL